MNAARVPLTFRIMVITDDRPDVIGRVARALSGPRTVPVAVQLRLKGASHETLLPMANALRTLTRARHAQLLIHSDPHIARAVGADGLHLPAHGTSVADARAALSPGTCVGVSCHTAAEVLDAASAGADYALLSPIHTVAGKAPPLGVEGFAGIVRLTPLPVLALGGIRAHDVSSLKDAGAAGFAVMRGVMAADDPEQALRALGARWETGLS